MSQPQPTTDRFERYTDRADAVIALAHYHAQRLRRDNIDTEHLLLAITEAGNGTAAMALAALGVSLDDVRRETQAPARAGHRRPGESIQFAVAASIVLDRAQHEADTMGHQYVGTDHLLLALTAQTPTRASSRAATATGPPVSGPGSSSRGRKPETGTAHRALHRVWAGTDHRTASYAIHPV